MLPNTSASAGHVFLNVLVMAADLCYSYALMKINKAMVYIRILCILTNEICFTLIFTYLLKHIFTSLFLHLFQANQLNLLSTINIHPLLCTIMVIS